MKNDDKSIQDNKEKRVGLRKLTKEEMLLVSGGKISPGLS